MVHFIINPVAGSGKAAKTVLPIEQEMQKRQIPYTIRLTSQPGDAQRFAQEACQNNSEGIICVGGDGTIQETASGMLYSGIPLGIVPAGSGNDFVQSLGFDYKMNLESILAIVFRKKVITIDAIKMNDLYFVNIGSTGLDAEIVKTALAYRKNLGHSAYVVATLKNILGFKEFYAKTTINGRVIEGEIILSAISNGKYYGGGIKIAPTAEMDDGWITVCIITKTSAIFRAFLFPLVFLGLHKRIKSIEFVNCKQLTIEYEGSRAVNLDGNLYHVQSPLHFEILPQAVHVIVP